MKLKSVSFFNVEKALYNEKIYWMRIKRTNFLINFTNYVLFVVQPISPMLLDLKDK